jgi:hypothetical protein
MVGLGMVGGLDAWDYGEMKIRRMRLRWWGTLQGACTDESGRLRTRVGQERLRRGCLRRNIELAQPNILTRSYMPHPTTPSGALISCCPTIAVSRYYLDERGWLTRACNVRQSLANAASLIEQEPCVRYCEYPCYVLFIAETYYATYVLCSALPSFP